MRIAVAGLGFMGATHAKAWTHVAGAELFAVISGDGKKLTGDLSGAAGNLGRDAIRLDFSRVRKYRTYDEALADPEIDAVDVCLPTDLHADAALGAMRSGKHVLVEKPLALTAADADRVAGEAERTGRVLMAAHVLRFFPAYVTARELLRGLGPVRNAFFRRRCAAPAWSAWLNDAARSGGGAFDLLIHDADYARWLLGMPVEIRAARTSDPQRGIDLVTANLEYRGCQVTIEGGWHLAGAYPFSMEFTIVAEDGVLEYNSAKGALKLYRTAGTEELISLAETDPFVAELSHFQDCAERSEMSLVCPPRESADAVRIAEFMCHRQHGASE
jgi:predicted dehydrogenase